jgi:DNA-binding GntR family transcriptional regulator
VIFDIEAAMLSDQNKVIDRRQLHERVLEYLRAAIMNGELRPGEFIRQQRIAEQLGVSQMPVRQALKQLAAESLVENIPYRGFSSEQYSINSRMIFFPFRPFWEGRAATTASSGITDEEVEYV